MDLTKHWAVKHGLQLSAPPQMLQFRLTRTGPQPGQCRHPDLADRYRVELRFILRTAGSRSCHSRRGRRTVARLDLQVPTFHSSSGVSRCPGHELSHGTFPLACCQRLPTLVSTPRSAPRPRRSPSFLTTFPVQ
jgi:hypothetical protein